MICISRDALRPCIFLIAFVAFFSGIIRANKTTQKLRVQVYYEALCPDSIQFVRTHLYNAMKVKGRMANTQLEMIPFGKANYHNTTKLLCQHGEEECQLNAWHACIIENHSGMEQLELINCMLSSQTNIIDKCGTDLRVNVTAVKNCKSKRTVADILRKYGESTKAIRMTFVPSVGFDGRFDPSAQFQTLTNFDAVYCRNYKQKYNSSLPKCS